METYLAFDPGEHTGWCLADELGVLRDYGQAESVREIEDIILLHHPDLIIYEGFRLFPSKATAQIGSRFPAAERIGAIQLVAARQGIPLREQMPQMKMFFKSAKRMKLYGFDIRSAADHPKDAGRHMLYYLVFFKKSVRIKKETDDVRPKPKPKSRTNRKRPIRNRA